MSDNQFPILGTFVPPMLGRMAIMQRMTTALTKAVPDHLQVVGPRFAGKTVLLHALATRLKEEDSPYSVVLIWDLGHQTPGTDTLFMQNLARELSTALRNSHSDYADFLDCTKDNPYQDIVEVLDLLSTDGVKVLVIMDGFDKPLSNGKLTRNLWDQLRDLALKSSLRLVTASRRTLRDLIRHPDAQTSDFWGIFDPSPVRVGCFNEHDLKTVLATMPERTFEIGAETELWNASNGYPVLLLDILNAVCEIGTPGSVTQVAINSACDRVFPTVRDKLDALWFDCPPSCQDLLRRVLEDEVIARTGIPTADIEVLTERGFVHETSNKLKRPNRLLGRYLADQPHEGNALVRLFGTDEAYRKNLKGVLERRIAQLVGTDTTLKRYLERSTEDMPDHPDILLGNIRGIVNQAFELIWNAEIPNRQIPSGWMAIWKRNNERRVEEWETTFPQGVHRVRLLNIMTGTDKSASCARYVTKTTYVLINAVHGFGDFGQHREGVPVNTGTAYAALHLCIELATELTSNLPK
ncbi:hypothetical protein JAB1_49970 [Janthinobacterium sp. MP5059B]|uniref:hypothetical protein n=1 Tax=Janthinobacterium sp. MP5059B TaxID=1766683 RepID=UPI000892A58A|nr:hypothetical protein [Janthinobacterium sp. MP5059B]OEZ46515.1 hypothetical protein JAB1_49970 [Janthinobacterium sp. MP5059B]